MAKAVLFDFGGTLDSDGVPWKDAFYPLYREAGMAWDIPSFERFFYASDDSLVKEGLDRVGYSAMLFEQVSRALRAGGCQDPELARAIAGRFYEQSMKCLERNRGILERLSERFSLGIVSNFYGNLPHLCQEIGYAPFLSAVVDSVCVGIFKPDAGIFQAALDQLRCSPEEAIFMGDNPVRDMAGAREVGMRHVWLNSLHPNAEPCCENDPVIRSLTELEELLA